MLDPTVETTNWLVANKGLEIKLGNISVVYFDQLLGAVLTQKLVKTFFQAFYNFFCSFQSFFSEWLKSTKNV